MSGETDQAILVENMTKAYRIWESPGARLKSPLINASSHLLPSTSGVHRYLKAQAQRYYRDFFALRDISFAVSKGESVGIIGRNGSGKSTLLQAIAGTLQPTSGSVQVIGRVAALLELGSGFNPDFSGRENVYLNAAVLGLSRTETDERFDQIAAFADIGDFIDQPVKTYSSGMVVRLAFAVSAHVDPDVLIIDEALSVGDARFQLKCARAIDRIRERGVTLLFVSHDLSMVKRLCQRAILLEHGRLLYGGHPNDVANLYSKLIVDGGSAEALADDIAALRSRESTMESPAAPPIAGAPLELNGAAPNPESPPAIATAENSELARLRLQVAALETTLRSHLPTPEYTAKVEALLADERTHLQASGQEYTYGGELGEIFDLRVLDDQGAARTWFKSGEAVVVRMCVRSFEALHEPIFALTIKNTAGVEIYGTNTLFSNQPAAPMDAGSCREINFALPLNLMPNHYFLSFGFTHFLGDQLIVIQRRYDAIKLEVHSVDRTFGIANLQAKISMQDLVPSQG